MNGFAVGPPLVTIQMVGPESLASDVPDPSIRVMLMTPEDGAEMFELISQVFPGFYCPRT
jgi:hypothetical protein